MRTYPAGFADLTANSVTLPVAYMVMPGSTWPAAHDGLAAGVVVLKSFTSKRELAGSLLPGQVRAPSGFAIATATVTFAQSAGQILAPWRLTAAERIAAGGVAEIIFSYDGPTGSTAMLMGTYRLDPIKGRSSDPEITVDLVEDWVKLRRPHRVAQPNAGFFDVDFLDSPADAPFDPGEVVAQIADAVGIPHDIEAFDSQITSVYFPPTKDALTCLQELVAANLGAAWSTPEGVLTVRTFQSLSGDGEIAETLDVSDQFADFPWSIDPGETFDRIEVSYLSPAYIAMESIEPATAWTAPRDLLPGGLAAGDSYTFSFDPKAAFYPEFDTGIQMSDDPTGASNAVIYADLKVLMVGTGRADVTITNNNAFTVYFWRATTVDDTTKHRTTLNGEAFDVSADDDKKTIEWGARADIAVNSLSVDLGKLIQTDADAQLIFDRIVSRASRGMWSIDEVVVAPDLRREIGDLIQIEHPDAGLSTKTLTTAIGIDYQPGELTQTLTLAVLTPMIRDFNAAWGPTATIADFNAFWAGRTFADFNANPLDH